MADDNANAVRERLVDQRSTRMPPGIPYIIGNEAAERFSYYGMRAILVVFMSHYLLDSSGNPAPMTEAGAEKWYHLFMSANYATPVLGAILADGFLGKYRTIIWLSLVYCAGHLALALDETRLGLMVGLSLIALGAGGIKPCVTAHVGDQFGSGNKHLMQKVFGWFYLAINLGAFVSMLLTPYLLESDFLPKEYRARVAFGVPGVLMLIATAVFYSGRRKFVQIPPSGRRAFSEATSPEGRGAIFNLIKLYLFLSIFWCLYDQGGSSWVHQATKMNLEFGGISWKASQVQAVNAILILVFVPLFSYVVYPALERIVRLTPLRKIAAGFFLSGVAFLMTTGIQRWIDSCATPSIGWQILAIAVMTAAEVLISVTFLEFSYTQAPNSLKSVIMAIYFLAVSLGNLIAALVVWIAETLSWDALDKFAAFTVMQFIAACIFVPIAYYYRERTYISDEKVASV